MNDARVNFRRFPLTREDNLSITENDRRALPGLQIPCPNAQSLCPVPSATSQPSCLHSSLCSSGLSKTSDQAYIEFESIEAIVKTASRTKFFIEFYSTSLEGLRRGPGLGVGHGGWEAGNE